MEQEGKYIYCIMESAEPLTFGILGIGGRGDKLYTISVNGISAVVSDSPEMNYSVSRENLLCHEKVIEEVMKDFTVLPVRFGTVALGLEKIKKILEEECDEFKEKLNYLKDKKELGLKAIFIEEAVYKNILEKYENIKTLKERFEKQQFKTYYERMEIGKMVESALEKEKDFYKGLILDVLSPIAVETKINNNYGERMLINAAFLIEKQKEKEFDEKIQELDGKFAHLMKFKYVGTVPPSNFVSIVIETEKY